MKELDNNKVGLIVGSFMGLLHLLWALVVAVGVAQVFMDWIYGLHFLNNPFQIQPFNLITAVTLIVVTFVIGYIAGWVFTYFWKVAEKKL